MEYTKTRDDINPDFDFCPARCAIDGKAKSDFCGNCEIGAARENFKNSSIGELNEHAPGWRKYGFEYLLQMVYETVNLETLPAEKQTIVVSRCIDILEGERRRERRTKEYQDRLNERLNANRNK